ncbi:MAG: ferrous iron transport protein B [Methanobacterium sp.]|uniref:ferrous iron transport protein B n=1 Tax=Methanobacterium sp. TaxID=2164 RepID=UPI003D648B1C|nr:ferrous iron transport protein B [Methanobacterium sp.]
MVESPDNSSRILWDGKKHKYKQEHGKNKSRNHLTIALAGNANVGKSVIFNELTGSNQIVGNWPGKTIERAEGKLCFEGYDIDVIDLPGIYSFSTFSMEEIVSREYIAFEKPDIVINVVDAAVLERNLFFTMQLKEMEVPLIVCVNQIDIAKQKGIVIDTEKLQAALGVPVISTVAVRGEGLHKLMETATTFASSKPKESIIEYGAEVENRISKLKNLIESKKIDLGYPHRWIAIKLLENDPEIKKMVEKKSEEVIRTSYNLAREIEEIHNEPSFSVIASERYAISNIIAGGAQVQKDIKISFSERLDKLATDRVFGYVIAALVIGGLLMWTFVVGNFFSSLLTQAFGFFQPVDPQISGALVSILWNGAVGGLVAGITLIIPFVIPFYLMLSAIENSGILTRVAFMMDSAMHKIGLHGKALIPLILGYGCNVPAIDSTRILETRRERLLAAFAITFAPCAARTIVILGLVAVFVSVWWAIALYVIDLLLIFLLGKIALKLVPGETTGLIMEMHTFKVPTISVIAKQTWVRTKSLIYLVLPIYIFGTAFVQALYILGVLTPISNFLAPLTVGWLGLPVIAGVLLIFGAIRKEFILLMLVAFFGTNLALVLSPVQFIVLALVAMLYLPCASSIAVLAKEFGWKSAGMITLANFVTAILIGGIAFRILTPLFN